MGVNLKGVNTIIHYGSPQSIDDYFQESGRGGRSGECARSVVFWKRRVCPMRKQLSSNRDHEVAEVRRFLENETICRRQWLLDYFEPSWACHGVNPIACCDSNLCVLVQEEHIQQVQTLSHMLSLMFITLIVTFIITLLYHSELHVVFVFLLYPLDRRLFVPVM